ncbi:hypothetical protein PVAP13_1KG542830 [Panicum virgatum]|uniref:Uncharacterized protein n=1 Tax=Panicum virgatum TaxID=38727 RepID=A0A8T0XWB1_PANVG|nr:hypothetical protein PVAP13_1KG542830 [Panicum virgatum]
MRSPIPVDNNILGTKPASEKQRLLLAYNNDGTRWDGRDRGKENIPPPVPDSQGQRRQQPAGGGILASPLQEASVCRGPLTGLHVTCHAPTSPHLLPYSAGRRCVRHCDPRLAALTQHQSPRPTISRCSPLRPCHRPLLSDEAGVLATAFGSSTSPLLESGAGWQLAAPQAQARGGSSARPRRGIGAGNPRSARLAWQPHRRRRRRVSSYRSRGRRSRCSAGPSSSAPFPLLLLLCLRGSPFGGGGFCHFWVGGGGEVTDRSFLASVAFASLPKAAAQGLLLHFFFNPPLIQCTSATPPVINAQLLLLTLSPATA